MIARIVVVLVWLCLLAPARADDALAATIRADLARGHDSNVLASCAKLTAAPDDVLERCTIAACRVGDAAKVADYARAIRERERVLYVVQLCEYTGVALPVALVDAAREESVARARRSDRLTWLLTLGLAVLVVFGARWERRRGKTWPLAILAVAAFANPLGALMGTNGWISPWQALASAVVGAVAVALAWRRRWTVSLPDAAPVAHASEADEAQLDLELARMDGHGELPQARARIRPPR